MTTPKTTARLILFLDCDRGCPDCCNEFPEHKDAAQSIASLDELERYEEIVVTGGEPMLKPNETLGFLRELRERFPKKKIYMYTARYVPELEEALDYLDGLHFTVHEKPTRRELVGLSVVQSMLWERKGSFRLYVDNRVGDYLLLIPSVWTRIEMKPLLGPGECPVPEHEDLLIWDGAL